MRKQVVHFPADVKSSQLITFLRVVHTLGGKADVAEAARELHTDLVMLLPILDSAEMLQLATVEKGEVELSRKGAELVSIGKSKTLPIRESLQSVEPFKTGLALKKFTAEQIASVLAKKGIRWHHEDTVNTAILKEMLIHWGISSGLWDYDGYTSRFTLKS